MNFCLSEETLQAHIDGELTEGAARKAMAHLAECASCARRIAEARQALSEISSKLDDHLPLNIPVERLCARFDDIVAEAVAAPVAHPSPISFSWRAAPAVASLLLATGVVAWLFLTTPKPEQVAIAPQRQPARVSST
jgi:anti-sigma factor RsiW